MKNSNQFDPFSAPIPGQSLTGQPGATPMEQPPQFTSLAKAADYTFDTMIQPRQSARLIALLRAGATCESIARSILFAGFMNAKWNVDMALLLARVVLAQVVAVAERAKSNGILKKFKILNPDVEQDTFMQALGGLENQYDVDEAEIKQEEQAIKAKPLELKGMLGGL